MPLETTSPDAPAVAGAAVEAPVATETVKAEKLSYVNSDEGSVDLGEETVVERTVNNEKTSVKVRLLNKRPTAFDAKIHKTPGLRDFETAKRSEYYEFKADLADASAVELRKKAELERTLGTSADRKKAKDQANLKTQMLDFAKQMRAEKGEAFSIDDLLAELS